MANTSTDLRSAGASRVDTSDDQIRPFRIEIPEEDLHDLRERLARTRWPDDLPVAMLPSMLIAMLLRRAGYSGHHHRLSHETPA